MALVKVTGLDHIVLRCADIEKSLAFYCDKLGLEAERVDAWRDNQAPFPSVRLTPTTIIDLFGGGPDGTNLDHFCLMIEPDRPRRSSPSSFPDVRRGDHLFGAQGYASSLYVHDPDGNTIELRSYA